MWYDQKTTGMGTYVWNRLTQLEGDSHGLTLAYTAPLAEVTSRQLVWPVQNAL